MLCVLNYFLFEIPLTYTLTHARKFVYSIRVEVVHREETGGKQTRVYTSFINIETQTTTKCSRVLMVAYRKLGREVDSLNVCACL